MAHEKVYGICEDKCRVEVYPKENTYSKDEVLALTPKFVQGEFIPATIKTGDSGSIASADDTITPPSGYSASNCMPILYLMYDTTNVWEQATYWNNTSTFCTWAEDNTVSCGFEYAPGTTGMSAFNVKFGVLFVPYQNS